ncbi:hypothetical protein A8B78_02060 [Jannaschia sp. EhC01]|nr:hypothetical protein A8B78_02060 [Jannaschia sp. EhC01]
MEGLDAFAHLDPADLTIAQAGAALRAKRLTCVALVQAHLDRVPSRDPDVGAFVYVAADEALKAAAQADAELSHGLDRGPLHGIPFAVKDLIDVEGWPVRFGSSRFKDRIALKTASCVTAMRDAGAIPLGLVATYELATVGPDTTSLYPQPRNPWNRNHVTGGSSSGSAAAVAAGLVRIAIGTDTAGSVRSPAAFCGVCGVKPEHGVISTDGVQPLAPSLDTVGALGRTVAETALMVEAMAGCVGLSSGAPTRLDHVTIGYARHWAMDDPAAHPQLLETLDAAASSLSLLGAQITLIDLPDYASTEALAGQILAAEQAETYKDVIADSGTDVGKMAYDSLLWGEAQTQPALASAKSQRETLRQQVDKMLAQYDAVICPTVLAPARPVSAFADGQAAWVPMRTIPFNLTGHAALSVPMGFADGLPLGLQIVTAFGRSDQLYRIGAAFEGATDHAAVTPYPA